MNQVGKRFTKTEVQQFSLDDLAGVPFPGIMKKIEGGRVVAENILHDNGLPTTATGLSWTDATGKEWHGNLEAYANHNLPHDSAEWYAAKIIFNHHRLQTATGDRAIELAFQIGQLMAFARVYQIMDRDSSKGGRSNKRKPWADTLAQQLCDLRDDDIYWELVDGMDRQVEVDGKKFDILLKDNLLQAIPFDDTDSPEKPQTIRFNSFIRHYIIPARKKQKKQ